MLQAECWWQEQTRFLQFEVGRENYPKTHSLLELGHLQAVETSLQDTTSVQLTNIYIHKVIGQKVLYTEIYYTAYRLHSTSQNTDQ